MTDTLTYYNNPLEYASRARYGRMQISNYIYVILLYLCEQRNSDNK